MAISFTLTVAQGPEAGLSVELQKRSFLLGRDPVCDLVVDDSEVSRRHARLIAQSGGYTVEDLGSTNGTFVNGQRIRTIVALKPGDSIGLGEQIVLSYQSAVAANAETRDFAATPPSASQVAAARSPHPALQSVPVRASSPTPASPTDAPAPDSVVADPEVAARPSRLRPRRKGLRLPVFSRPWMIGCAAVILLGICATIAVFWYIDANYLWCDVFGTLISACR